MDTNRFTGMGHEIAAKLREARRGTGLSTRAVCEMLNPSMKISHATVHNYERGRSQPDLSVLAALAAIYNRPINWFLERGPALTGIRYRSFSSKLKLVEKHKYEAEAARLLEGYVRIENFVGEPLKQRCKIPRIAESWSADRIASEVRKALQFDGRQPIPSVVDCMEALGIRVIELPTDLKIDGFAAMLGGEPVVVINSNRSPDRIRLSAAHEMFHHVLGHCIGGEPIYSEAAETPAQESLSYDCGRRFLLPQTELERAVVDQSFVTLVKFKEEFGISMSAMLYAANKTTKHLPDAMAKRIWIQISQRGWREKEPGVVRPDRARRFESLIDGAVQSKRLTYAQAATVMGIDEPTIHRRVSIATGIDPDAELLPVRNTGGERPFTGMRLAN